MPRFLTFLFKTLLVAALGSSTAFAAEPARVVFIAGDATVAGHTAQIGDNIHEGEALATGATGYLYLKTRDGGFFILRPNSAGQITSYQIDTLDPSKTRIKIELQQGVARHISGDAVKKSRQNFRFNTPVAAIGVRGTDFTVFASQETTRIAVLSGGVIVSPISGDCLSSGSGPCEDRLSRELFANNTGQMLQVNRGQAPMLTKSAEQAPDAVTPPRTDEPSAKSGSSSNSSNGTTVATSINLDPLKAAAIGQIPPPQNPPQLIWGRWQTVLNQAIEVDIAALQASYQLIATNHYYALMRNHDSTWQRPEQTTLGFSIRDAQAIIINQVSQQPTLATIENGQLQLDFAKSSFFTKFDLVNLNERFLLQNRGEISPDGRLYGGNQLLLPNNMDVRGALSNDSKTAAYLFQSRLDEQRIATGTISWGK